MPIAAHPTSAAATAVQQQLQIVEGGGARARPGPTEREQQQQSNSPIPTPRFVTRPMAGGLIRPELVRPSVTVAAQQPAQPGTGVYQVRINQPKVLLDLSVFVLFSSCSKFGFP